MKAKIMATDTEITVATTCWLTATTKGWKAATIEVEKQQHQALNYRRYHYKCGNMEAYYATPGQLTEREYQSMNGRSKAKLEKAMLDLYEKSR